MKQCNSVYPYIFWSFHSNILFSVFISNYLVAFIVMSTYLFITLEFVLQYSCNIKPSIYIVKKKWSATYSCKYISITEYKALLPQCYIIRNGYLRTYAFCFLCIWRIETAKERGRKRTWHKQKINTKKALQCALTAVFCKTNDYPPSYVVQVFMQKFDNCKSEWNHDLRRFIFGWL